MTDSDVHSSEIRTPDQRLRVFISSTLGEMAEERAAVSRAISSLRLTPVLFELGARPHPPRELYRAYLEQSDIFIGLYWQRYGWIAPDMDISGLEDEFQLSGDMPRLLYLKEPSPEREDRLAGMLHDVATESYRHFRTPRELGRLVRDDLAVLLSERFVTHRAPTPPPPASRPRPPRSLPLTTTSLIGREADLEQVTELLQKREVRLVTLTGPGGIGKTRLAVAVGERLDADYPAGVAFVPLAAITEPELVLPRIAAAVGATVEGRGNAVDAIAERLEDTPTLVVLDNLEQVVGVAPELDRLLARCPGLNLLATSRTVLRLQAEREYPVAALAVPAFPEQPPLDEIAALPAVQLFVDRARTVRRDFALTDSNAATVAELCRRLEGLPLAIELAAARIRLLDPAALLNRLSGRLDALGSGPVDLPERQRTLRATVEWSVGLLNDDERDFLATLSVFVDGWSIDAAAEVAGRSEDTTLDLLDALAGHSLVQVIAGDAGPRFRMLESVRNFTAELSASSPDHAEIQQRHAHFFRRFIENLDRPAQGTDQTPWLDTIAAEEGNLRVAIDWFLADDIAPLPHMFSALWLYWVVRDRLAEGREWIDQVMPQGHSLDERCQIELLLVAAAARIELGDDEGALAAAAEIEHLEGRIDDPYWNYSAQMTLAWVLPLVDINRALQAADAAVEGFRQLDDKFLMASSLTTRGMFEMEVGQDDTARRDLIEVVELGGSFGSDWPASGARTYLAALAVRAGDFNEARALLDEALATDDDTSLSTHTISFCLVGLAQLTFARGDARQAATALGAAAGLRERAGLKLWPSARPSEAALLAQVEESLGGEQFQQAFDAGSALARRDAIALARG